MRRTTGALRHTRWAWLVVGAVVVGLGAAQVLEASPQGPSDVPGVAAPPDGPSGSPSATSDPEPVAVLLPGPWTKPPVDGVHAFRRGAYPIRDSVLDLRSPVDWTGLARLERTTLRLVHALLPLHDLAAAARDASVTEQARMADEAMELVSDWWAANPRDDPSDAMAWHDETTAKRTLSILVARERLGSHLEPVDRELLWEILGAHADALADPAFHTTGTNHGMFQDMALLAWSASARTAATATSRRELALTRLSDYFDQVVGSDGVHLEHSPTYHYLVARILEQLTRFLEAEGVTDHPLTDTFERMRSYATHVIQPDGSLPLVGDTFAGAPIRNLWDDPGIRWVRSGGARGEPPVETGAVYPDSGYVVFRDSWTRTRAYVHFTAAYHGAYHKHSDDLSVWYWLDGELLTEAGPNGYEYEDPDTIFGYSSAAHNTLLVDGRGLERLAGRASQTELLGGDAGVDEPWATGRTTRYEGVTFERTVRLRADGPTLVVRDDVTVDGPRRLTFLWHLAPGVTAEMAGDRAVRLLREGVPVAVMTVTGAEPRIAARGDSDASLRLGGARIPTWLIRVEVVADRDAAVTHVVEPVRQGGEAAGK